IQAILPVYVGGGWENDWYTHYEEALVFIGERPVSISWDAGRYTLVSHTPLFNLVTAAVMEWVGDAVWVYQAASGWTHRAILLVLGLLLRDLFGPRAVRLGLILAALNIWILHQAWWTWTKMLTSYYDLLGLHFYLRWLRTREEDERMSRHCLLGFWAASLL